jgi:aspartyl-tRNA(Asn)/glutamyl-tRNA(Gln) amidotransferase subunit A
MGNPVLPCPTIADAAAALAAGDVSATNLCSALLDRVQAVDSRVGAYLHLDREDILQQAAAADHRRQAGKPLGRLDGIPIAVKDNLAVRGQPCTCASKILASFRSIYDATVIEKLRAQGVIFFGRTNMDEFAMGSSTENSGIKPTRNPWNTECVPGGSSGGSAAAVAAGEAIAALGSDTGGSIRQPAGFCGVVGLKPSYGRVSRYGLVAYASSLDQIGPITRDVRDSAILMDLLGGHDPRDCTSLPGFTGGCEQVLQAADPAKLRIGMPKEYFEVDGLDPEVERTVRDAAAKLEAAGAKLVEISLPLTRYAIAAYYIVATAEASANLARFDGIRYGFRDREGEADSLLETYRQSRAAGFGDEVKRRIILGTFVLSSGYYDAYYLRAQKVRTLIQRDFRDAFTKCDVILSPTAPTPAFKAGAMTSPLQMYLADIYTTSANLAGICGVAVPAALSGAGMPISVQFLGPAGEEASLLQAAHVFETVSGWQKRIPHIPNAALDGKEKPRA